MADTHGFEVVAELRESSLKELLKAAWKSGGDDSNEGVIPEQISIPGPSVPATTTFGPYQISSGMVQIPQDQLDLSMDVPIDGVRVKLGTIIHVEIANPPIDSAKLFDMTADVFVRTPIRGVNNDEIVADFTALPSDGVTVNITSGDPIGPITNAAIEEFVHKKYNDNSIPHVIDPVPISFLVFNMKARIDFYDDVNSATQKITIQKPDATHVKVLIPCHLRFYDITGNMYGQSLHTPMGVNGVAVMTADFTQTTNNIFVKTSTATVELTNITAASGEEGTNYTYNKSIANIAGQDLDALIKTGFATGAASQLKSFGDISVDIPTLDAIEGFIENAIKAELQRRKQMQIWKVQDLSGTNTTISNVTPKALSDAMAICINDMGGANAGAITNFIPSGNDFAIATAAQKVKTEFNKQRDQMYPELKDGHSHTFDEKIKGKTVRLNSLGLDLHDGYLDVNGEVTIVDAILDSVDVDAGFHQKVKLHWEDSSDGGQMLKHDLDGDPDVSMGAAAWILSALIGFLTLGIVGVIIAVIIMAVVESVASQIGGSVAKDESGKVTSIGAWPDKLDKIGNVSARFKNPVIIETTGLVFAGEMIIKSTYALTSVDMARSHGPYFTVGNNPVHFNGGAAQTFSSAQWNLGNGAVQSVRSLDYRYGKSGVYVSHVQIKVNEDGGLTSKHYTTVKVQNVAPVVTFDKPNIQINEGQEVELKASFTDDNWLDKHVAWFDFGDNSSPADGVVTETNNEPQALGEVSVKHAWCDNGFYTVTLFVKDDAGGMGQATMVVEVTNVPPKIIAPKRLCVLRHQPVRLEVMFTDPGWCDTHVATWDTGDGTIKMSTIKENHHSPELVGIASVSHIYCCLGNYIAKVTVTDDDGGEDSAIIIVSVVELGNANFENGFRYRVGDDKRQQQLQMVANEWQPFAQSILLLNETTGNSASDNSALQVEFDADEFICRNGQRSQAVKLGGSGLAGIRQTICVNCFWDYEFTAYYHLPVGNNAKCVIGIDASGGTDASNNDIQWVEALPVQEWVHASVRVTAKASKITCFVGILQSDGVATIYIDKCALFMIQPLHSALLERRKQQDESCPVDRVETHDFNKLDERMKSAVIQLSPYVEKYTSTMEGVRFTNTENPAPRFALNKETGLKLAQTLVKGVANISGNIAKGAVSGFVDTIISSFKKGQKG